MPPDTDKCISAWKELLACFRFPRPKSPKFENSNSYYYMVYSAISLYDARNIT